MSDYSLIKESFDKYVVTPVSLYGLGGFVFDVDGETTITAENDITDHYVEDRTAVQDHIAVKPVSVTLTSYVGELTDIVASDEDKYVQKAVEKLVAVETYLPQIATQTKAVKKALSAGMSILDKDTINDVNNLWATIKNSNPASTRQQQAYLYFKALRDQKILVNLQTPFEFLPNMAIETLTATQSEDSKFISTFSITLKQIRTVDTKFVSFNKKTNSGRAGQQKESQTNKGKAQGKSASLAVKVLKGIFK